MGEEIRVELHSAQRITAGLWEPRTDVAVCYCVGDMDSATEEDIIARAEVIQAARALRARVARILGDDQHATGCRDLRCAEPKGVHVRVTIRPLEGLPVPASREYLAAVQTAVGLQEMIAKGLAGAA